MASSFLASIISAPIVYVEPTATPSIPQGLRIKSHRTVGRILVSEIALGEHSLKTAIDHSATGWSLQRLAGSRACVDAGVLDFLLAHPEHIPATWKGKFVYFLGTIYRDKDDDNRGRCLYFRGNCWVDATHPLARPVGRRSTLAVY